MHDNFWDGFEKQSGWKKNLAMGAGALGVAGAAGYGAKKMHDSEIREMKSNVRSIPTGKQALWSQIKEKHGLTGVTLEKDTLGYYEAYSSYEEAVEKK